MGLRIDWEQLDEVIGDDPDGMVELLHEFLSDIRSKIDAIEQAVLSNDIKQVVWLAHQLKGSASNLGFIDFVEEASVIEEKGREGSLENAIIAIAHIRELFERSVQEIKAARSIFSK